MTLNTPMPMLIRRWLVLLAVLFSVNSVVDGAAAQDRDSPEYKDAIRKALQEYELGNWAEAKVFFSDAHALFPNARTLRGLALTSYALRDYVQAISYFEQSLASQVQPLSPQLQDGAREYLQQAKRFVAKVTLRVEPASAAVRIDDVAIKLGADGSVQLNPGQHELVATAPGYEPLTRRWNVEAGARSELVLQLRSQAQAVQPLAAAPVAAVSSEPVPAQQDGASEGGGSAGPWILVGVSGALAIGGGVLLAVTASDISSVENAEKNTPWSEVESAYERSPAYSAAGFAMLGVGVAGVAVGLAWAFWPDEKGDEQRVALDISPTGLGLHGRF